MYNSVYNELIRIYPYNLRKQTFSLGITDKNVDIVPARRISSYTTNTEAKLYNSNTGGNIKTDIPGHKKFISESQEREVMKLMKVWKLHNNIPIKSFAMEILVAKALKNNSFWG